MKKIISTMVIIITVVLFFYIYHTKLNSQVNSEQVQQEEVIVRWMLFGEKSRASDVVFHEFNQILKQYYPDTTVEFEFISKDHYKERWNLKMATNEVVDIAWMGSDAFNYIEEVKKGSLMAIDYLLKNYGHQLSMTIEDTLWERQRCDGNIYGIPIPGISYRKSYFLMADQNFMEDYGDIHKIGQMNRDSMYTTRECYQSFEPFLQNMNDYESLGTGISYQGFCDLADKGYEGIYGVDSPFVIRIFDDRPIVYNKYDLESYYACFETMSGWYQKGFIRGDVADVLNPREEDGRQNGSVLYIDDYGDKQTVPDLIIAEYDSVREGLEGYRYVSFASCRNYLVIPKSAENPQRAMEIINFLYSDEGRELYRLLVNGIEGEHYIRRSENLIAKVSDIGSEYLYQMSPYTIGNAFQNFELEEGQFKQLIQNNTNVLVSPLLGFDLDTRMIAIEMAKVDLVVEKYKTPLCQGILNDWEKSYYEFLIKMREAGSEKIIQEMQRQIDEFLVSAVKE